MKLGDKLQDRVTGFTGIAVAEIQYLNGCKQFCIKPRMSEDGKMPEGQYIDIHQLQLVPVDRVAPASISPGGVHPDQPSE